MVVMVGGSGATIVRRAVIDRRIRRLMRRGVGVTGPMVVAMVNIIKVQAPHRPSERVGRMALPDRMEHAVCSCDGGLDDKQPDEHGGEHPHPSSQLFVRLKDHRRPDQQLSSLSSPFSPLRAMATIAAF